MKIRVTSTRTPGPGWGGAVWAAVIAVLLAGCGEGREKPAAGGVGDTLSKTVTRGPISATVSVDQPRPTVADVIELSVEAIAGEDHDIAFPEFEEEMGAFTVLRFEDSEPELLEGKRLRHRRIYKLEPFLAGDYEIPPLEVRYRLSDDGEFAVLPTEPLHLTVASVLPPDGDRQTIHENAEPVGLPDHLPGWKFWAILGVVLLAVGAACFFWVRRRRPEDVPAVPPRIAAPEHALADLERLLAGDLLRRGEFKPFYQRLSDILRRYIEARFGVHAPEQTTEEFLESMRRHPDLFQANRDVLKDFLRHCDLVKFAEHLPELEEVDSAVATCRRFVEMTRERPESEVAAAGAKESPVAQN